MKSVILLTVLFLIPINLTRSQDSPFTDGNKTSRIIPASEELVSDDERQIEDDLYSLEPDIFSRKLYQKTLKALSKKEKIIWSFKMADKDIFL